MKIDLSPRRVANSDLVIDRLILGTMTFGPQVNEADAAKMVGRARDRNIRMFDSANSYNAGVSEEILGRVVKPFRKDIQITTKTGLSKTDKRPLSRESILREVDASLKRLGTDYVDIFFIHVPDRNTPFDETLSALDELVRSGRARYVGQSNHAAWQITEFHALAGRNAWPKLCVAQQMYNLLSRRMEDDYAECSRHLGLFNIAYNPLAGGLLTGKHNRGGEPAPGSRFTQVHYRVRYWNDQQLKAVNGLQKVAEAEGISMTELAFRWLLSRPLTDGVLLGASSLEQLDANIAAASGEELSSEAIQTIDEIWGELRGAAPNYQR